MNEEVEIKVFLKNSEEVLNTLNKIAEAKGEKIQIDEYYIPENNDFFKTNPTKEYLRIRKENNKAEIEYHFCHFDDDGSLLKTDEYETIVNDADTLAIIFEKIGIKKKIVVKKTRKTFELPEFEILVDHIEGLGYFLEIESKNDSISYDERKKSCYDLLSKLDAKWKKTPAKGYPDMLLEKF